MGESFAKGFGAPRGVADAYSVYRLHDEIILYIFVISSHHPRNWIRQSSPLPRRSNLAQGDRRWGSNVIIPVLQLKIIMIFPMLRSGWSIIRNLIRIKDDQKNVNGSVFVVDCRFDECDDPSLGS